MPAIVVAVNVINPDGTSLPGTSRLGAAAIFGRIDCERSNHH
jgi:hypothetical protein